MVVEYHQKLIKKEFFKRGNEMKKGTKKTKFIRVLALTLVFVQLFVCIPFASVFAAEAQTVVITGSSVNVRSGAGTNYPSAGTVSRGEIFAYLAEAKDGSGTTWYKIQYGASNNAWVTSQFSSKVSFSYDDPEAYLESTASAFGAAGIQVALIREGIAADTFNYGYAVKGSVPMASDTKLRVASISKVVVAMNAMRMQEQNVVNVDSGIGAYWGKNPYKAVTLKSLFSHTSTLKDLGYSSTKDGTLAQLTSSSSYNSGTVGSSSVWAYNNYGVGVAGTTLELASGQVLDNYADTHFFKPLGIEASWHPGSLPGSVAELYRYGGDVARTVAQQRANSIPASVGVSTAYYAGGLTISAKDTAKLFAVLANDGFYAGNQYLSPTSVAAMEKKLFSAGSFYQCMPLRCKDGLYGQGTLYYHTGNAYGMLALASYNPSTRNGVVVITTGAAQNTDSNGIYSICGQITEYMYKYIAATTRNDPEKPAESISLGQDNIKMNIGDTIRLSVASDPADADDVITWSSSSKSVTVDQNGNITAVGYGTAEITAAGYSASGKCTVTVEPEVEMKMLGAGIRLSDPYGIRFGTQIIKDDVFNSLNVVEYGTIITGTGNLGDSELTLDFPNMQRIKAAYLMSSDSQQLTFTGVIVKIPESSFNTNLVGRGYLIYKDADGIDRVIYSDTAVRSFTGVAESAYEKYSSSVNPSSTELAMLEKLERLLGINADDADNIESFDPDAIQDEAYAAESLDTPADESGTEDAEVPEAAPENAAPESAVPDDDAASQEGNDTDE